MVGDAAWWLEYALATFWPQNQPASTNCGMMSVPKPEGYAGRPSSSIFSTAWDKLTDNLNDLPGRPPKPPEEFEW